MDNFSDSGTGGGFVEPVMAEVNGICLEWRIKMEIMVKVSRPSSRTVTIFNRDLAR